MSLILWNYEAIRSLALETQTTLLPDDQGDQTIIKRSSKDLTCH